MAGVTRLFSIARQLGDLSSLTGGQDVVSWSKAVTSVKARAGRRVGGRALSGIFRMNVWGLILWGEFFNEFRNQIQLYNAREVYVGTAVTYAYYYEFGFKNPTGKRRHRPFFFPAVTQATMERKFGSRVNFTPLSFSRSGLYSGGRFVADIRAIKKGTAGVGARGIRRSTGAQTSRLFWGTLRNPKFNVLHALAERTRVLARKNIQQQGLVSSGVLLNSIAVGNTFDEMLYNSRRQVVKAFKGDVPTSRIKWLFGSF